MEDFEVKRDKDLLGNDVEVEAVTMTNEERLLHPDLKDTSRRDMNPIHESHNYNLGQFMNTISSLQAV